MPKITVQTTIHAPLETVWDCWTKPEHITQWNQASDDWHSPHAENDLRVGGTFSTRMEAKDGSEGFDFKGVYTDVQTHKYIAYTMDDGRDVSVTFSSESDGNTTVVETFDAEETNPIDMQRDGWQAILNTFASYTEKQA